MTIKAERLNGADPYAIDRHFADFAPVSSASSAVASRTRGAADRMWQRVEEDLEKMDRADIAESDDD
jgi:hypothetical protein